MWDQLDADPQKVDAVRIIPTYVGSTPPPPELSLEPPNHSHVCGINVGCLFVPELDNESFPRMWDQHIVTALLKSG